MSHAYQKGTVFQGVPHIGFPDMIVRNYPQRLAANWYIDGSRLTATAATLTLKQGSKVILDGVAATVGGSQTVSYDLLATDTENESLGADYLEIWKITATWDTSETVEFRRAAYLVRSALWPMVSDADLVARHSRLDDLLPPGQTSWADYRELAWEILNRDLIKKGRRPQLILDSFALIDAHVFKTLEVIFRDLSTLVGDGRYTEFAILYGEAYTGEFEVMQFRYDRDQDNAIDPGELESGSPSLWLGVPPGFPSSVVKGN